jgi:pimeloyl-ACP methyl ester carboxylesterase
MVLLDLWGHGLSDTPVLPHEGALFHRLIDNLLAHLGWLADGGGGGGGVGIVGFSFGAVLTMGYLASLDPERRGAIQSYALVAPAGLVRKSWFTPAQRAYLSLECAPEDEAKAAAWVESVLEGGERRVPEDWQDRVSRGQIVAEALREWQVKHHAGHPASVTAIFRDGEVTDNDELFVRAKETGVPSLVVLGADDDLSTEKEIRDFGFDVRVVKEAGHGVVRDRAGEVAECIAEFWRGL